MEEEQNVMDYLALKSDIEDQLDSFDYNVQALSDLSEVIDNTSDQISTENFKLLSIPVNHYYKKLGITEQSITLEGIKENINTGWEKITEIAIKLFNSIKAFLIKVKDYIVSIFKKKSDNQRKEFHDLKKEHNVDMNYSKEININVNDSESPDIRHIANIFTNSETNHLTYEYINDKLLLIEDMLSELISESDKVAKDQIKNLNLEKFINKKLPFEFKLIRNAYINNGEREIKYAIVNIPSDKLIPLTEITTSNIDKCTELLDGCDRLDKVIDRLKTITEEIEKNSVLYLNKMRTEYKMKKVSNTDRYNYIQNLRVIYGVLFKLSNISVKMNRGIIKYNELSYRCWFKD